MGEKTVNLILRLPEDLHAALVELSRQEQRSLNRQIVYSLQETMERRKKDKDAEKK